MATGKVKCLVILSGIPGSGKSTLASLLCDHLCELIPAEENRQQALGNNLGVVVIPYDDIIPAEIHIDDISPQTWKLHREEIVLCIDTFLDSNASNLNPLTKSQSSISDAVWEKFFGLIKKQMTGAERMILLIDDNMFYTSMRHRYFQLARKYNCGFCQVYLSCDIQTALVRNKERTDPVPDDVILNMKTKIEPPNTHENSWEKNSLIINTESCITSHLQKIASLVKEAMLNPVPPLDEPDPTAIAESGQITSANVIHQSDQILRKIVGMKMAELKNSSLDKPTLQQLSKIYVDVRKSCLVQIKSGQVAFPVSVDKPNISCNISSELYLQILRLFESMVKDLT